MTQLTLLTKSGLVHRTGGLNWGSNPDNHTTPLDAYIPLHIETIRRNTGLFNSKGASQTVLKFTWDDGFIMQGLFEGTQTDIRNGLEYPKQISSYPTKRILGGYLRNRMNLAPSHIITLQDLINYGRTTVDITQTGTHEYLIDYHV